MNINNKIYSGLNDKNNNKIYKGDFIKFNSAVQKDKYGNTLTGTVQTRVLYGTYTYNDKIITGYFIANYIENIPLEKINKISEVVIKD